MTEPPHIPTPTGLRLLPVILATLGAAGIATCLVFSGFSGNAGLRAAVAGIFVTALVVLAIKTQRHIDTLISTLAGVHKDLKDAQAQGNSLQRAEAAEAERGELLQRMTLAMNAAGISLWEWNIKGDKLRIMEGSPFTARLGGRTECRGTEYPNLVVHPEERPQWVSVFEAALAQPPGEDMFLHRYRAVYPDGSTHWIQFHARIQRNSAGAPRGLLAVDWDVTEEVRAAEEIAEQTRKIAEGEARLARAVSGTRDTLFELSADMDRSWISPRINELLGYEPGEFKLTTDFWGSLLHPDDYVHRLKRMHQPLERRELVDVDYRLRKKNGEWLWVRVRAKGSDERDSNGQPMLFSGAIRDITDERAAREKLIAATQAAEEASRAKSAFLATMSHEIRTPMNGILGMTTLLLDSSLGKVQREYASTVLSSAESLLTILNDILDFSKIEAGKLEVEAIEMDLISTIEEIGSLMAFQCAAKNLELIVNISPEVPEQIVGDPQRIRQCLLNLVGNSVKFTHHGEVFIDVFTAGQQNGKTLVHFEVRDTGPGIEPEILGKLFQPFTQADSTTTRRYGGTGLGLSIVQRLVDLMGGQVGAQSEPGKGSLFWFQLACSAAASTGALPMPGAQTSATTYRVLLVDDNETNLRVLAGQLRHAGYEVESVASGAKALTLMRERIHLPFDLVLLDFEMPGMDGAALGEAILRDPLLARTRLIMLTSMDREGDIKHFADAGFAAYIAKPLRRRELLRCLRKVLGHEADAWHGRSQPMITQGSLLSADRGAYRGTVLIVEDNVINQRVASRFLERAGCKVEIAADGAQAVGAFEHGAYGLIFMDMQMPVMDGLEATRRIRAIETREQRVRTPIVAVTANAHAGQMEICLEAGMDDYLTKPLDINRMRNMLDRYIDHADNHSAESAEPSTALARADQPDITANDAPIFGRLRDIADDDDEFALELVAVFVDSGKLVIEEMRDAIAAGDLHALRRAAHKLKGASNNLHIAKLGELAEHIELDAKAGSERNFLADMHSIAREFERISTLLSDGRSVSTGMSAGARNASVRN
jgi:two-component system sensor histidine kinase/response regulator